MIQDQDFDDRSETSSSIAFHWCIISLCCKHIWVYFRLLCSCCENKIHSSYSLIFTTGDNFSLLCFCCENKSGLAISYFHNRNTTAWNTLKYACNIGLLYINGKLLMSSFEICHQNLDPGSSRSVNLDKPDRVLKEWTFLLFIKHRVYIYQQKAIEEPVWNQPSKSWSWIIQIC